jgi:hypothetical protein
MRFLPLVHAAMQELSFLPGSGREKSSEIIIGLIKTLARHSGKLASCLIRTRCELAVS